MASSGPSSVSNRPPLASETGGVEDRVFHTEEIGQLLLQLLMRITGAADEAYRGHPKPWLSMPDFAAAISSGGSPDPDSYWRRS